MLPVRSRRCHRSLSPFSAGSVCGQALFWATLQCAPHRCHCLSLSSFSVLVATALGVDSSSRSLLVLTACCRFGHWPQSGSVLLARPGRTGPAWPHGGRKYNRRTALRPKCPLTLHLRTAAWPLTGQHALLGFAAGPSAWVFWPAFSCAPAGSAASRRHPRPQSAAGSSRAKRPLPRSRRAPRRSRSLQPPAPPQ